MPDPDDQPIDLSATASATAEHVVAEIADGTERSLHPDSIAASRIGGGVTVVIVAVVSLAGLLGTLLANSFGNLINLAALGGWLAVIVALAALSWTWPGLRYRHTSYRVDSERIRIRRGVLWRMETTVPRSRIQHTDVSRGPVERSFGLATLIVHTAGTEQASVSLSGLPADAAFHIRDYLIEAGEGDAV